MRRTFVLALLLLVLVLGCASQRPVEPKGAESATGTASPGAPGPEASVPSTPPDAQADLAASGEPAWLTRARAREATLDGSWPVGAADAWFVARVPARPEPGSAPYDEGVDYAFDFDVAVDASISCRVLRVAGSPSERLQSTSLALFESLERSVGPIGWRRIEQIVVGSLGPAPFMGIDWLFGAGAEDETAGTNALSLRFAVKDEAGLLCLKLGLGYEETLRAIFESLVGSFERADPPPPAALEEVVVVSFSGRRLGVGQRVVRRDDEGDLRDELLLHVLAPVAPDRTTAITSYRYEWVDGRDLRLVNAGMTSLRDGEETLDLALVPSTGAEPLVIGGHRAGEPIEVVLPGEREVESQLAAIARTRAALAGSDPKGETRSSRVWSDVSPLEISDATLRIDALVDPQHARGVATVGTSVIEVLLERATGQTVASRYDAAGTSIAVERVFARGAP